MPSRGSRGGEPLALDGEREAGWRRRGVDREIVTVESETRRKRRRVDRETRRKRRRVDRKPLAQGGETTDERASLEEESRGFSSSSPNIAVSPKEESPDIAVSDVEDICDEMADRFIKLMADHAACAPLYPEQVRKESVDGCKLTMENEFCDVDDGSFRSCKARKVAVIASKSVVSLSSFSDKKRIRVCSGSVIEYDPSTTISKILTSATLVRSLSSRNTLIPDLKVKVGLPNGHVSDGLISMVDFHYNLALVEVKSTEILPEAILVNQVVKKGKVLAVGRFYDHGGVMCAQGKIRKEASTFDCPELLVSSCKTTMAGVGGPLVNYSGHVLGVNFYGENQTPFLSTAIIIRCLDHWKSYGKIIRPWFGLLYTPVGLLPLQLLEKCMYIDKGFYISKAAGWWRSGGPAHWMQMPQSQVTEGSPADVAGLCVGDVLIECAGKGLSTAPELGALLLDLCKEQMESCALGSNLTVEVVVRKQMDGRKARKTVTANVLSESSYYSWIDPLPSYNGNKMATVQVFKS